MKNAQATLGQRLLLSSSRNRIGKGCIFFLSYLLLFASLIFTVEIVLILLGVGDVFVPFTGKVLDVLNEVVY